jgi:hypothetical protein
MANSSHNEEDGHVDVVTETRSGRAVLSVVNGGPVVPAADVDRQFEPFERLGANRRHAGASASGSIVLAIAEAHSATIDAQPHLEGGLHVDVSFRAAGRHLGGRTRVRLQPPAAQRPGTSDSTRGDGADRPARERPRLGDPAVTAAAQGVARTSVTSDATS